MYADQHIAELRAWHELVSPRMTGFGDLGRTFDFAAYARWRDVGVLLRRISDLEQQLASIQPRSDVR